MTDAQSICKKMDGLHILYAGDSVIEQVFISATHALGANFDAQNNQWQRNYGRYESLAAEVVRLGTSAATCSFGTPQDRTRDW